jgi:integrase/recombinase XerD
MHHDSSALDRAVRLLRRTTLSGSVSHLVAHFQGCGYVDATIARYVRIASHFGLWLDRKRLAPSDFSEDLVLAFLNRHLPRCRCRARIDRDRKCVRAALVHLASVLRQAGVAPAGRDREHWSSATRRELDRFDKHLDHTRGVAAETRVSWRRYVGYFLERRFGEAPVVPGELRAEDFRRFLLDRSSQCRPGTIGVIATALRSYLRYLVLCGHPVEGLIQAVPRAAQWSKARLPQHLTEEQEECLLRAPDQSRPSGRRDYAMFLVMCRLGLRVGEVADLTLGDFDWSKGTVSVHAAKSRRTQLLPVPPLVGDAVIAYLKDGRPGGRDRHVFLRHRPPVGRPVSKGLIRGAVRSAYESAGLPSSWTGTHRLRHTAAVRMVRGHASIKQIADVLGHRCVDTTAIYAKVDVDALREVALPWPGRAQ